MKSIIARFVAAALGAAFFMGQANAQWQGPTNAIPYGQGAGVTGFGYSSQPVRAGDLLYWNGTSWTTLPGNNSGTNYLSENASGVPSWASSPVTSATIAAGTGITVSGTCTITTTGTCTVNGLHGTNPTNLYVSTTGSDANNCLSSGTACLTIQRAVTVGLNYDFQGAPITINLAAGTYTKGVIISGTMIGQVNGNGAAPMFKIVGVAGSTFINLATGTGCSPASGIQATDGAIVGVGSVGITTSCSGGNGLAAYNGGTIYLVDGNVNLGGATNAGIYVSANGRFDANYGGSFGFTISGGGSYGIAISTHGIVVTGIGITNTISGTPNFSSAFLSCIDGSFYNEGINATWTGAANAVGPRYALAENCHVDREQNAGNLPGSTIGTVQGGSWYYQNNAASNSDRPCVGGASGCRTVTAPTGMGTGGTVTMFAGSGDHSGAALLAFGTAPGGSGDFIIAQLSQLTGDYGGNGFCVVSLNNNSTLWPSGSYVQSYYDSSGIHIHWIGTVAASTNYYISYVCN